MLALSRQTVNQLLRQLESNGVVRLGRGGIEILDLAQLQILANL
jgi:CRP-like cAMP-binding protein